MALSGNDLFTLVQNINDRLHAIEETGIIPVGLIAHVPGPVPNGWLLCDGSAIDPNRYGALRVYLKSLTLPDLKGRVIVADSTSGTFATMLSTGGVETVTLTSAQSGMPSHQHTPVSGNFVTSYNGINQEYNLTSGGGTFLTGVYGTTATISAANAASSHSNLQPYIVLAPIIKF